MKAFDLGQVNHFVLRKHHLNDDTKIDNIVQIVSDIFGLHATGAITPYLSLFSRMENFKIEQLNNELSKTKTLAKIRCVRKTVYIVPKETIPTVFAATRKMVSDISERHYKYLGISEQQYEEISKDIMEIIKGRRSIRRYEEKAVPEDVLNRILESIQWSPSWANTQCWEVIVVRDAKNKENLQGAVSGTNPASKAMVEAPVVLVLCGKLKSAGYYKEQVTTKHGDWFMFDLGLATQNLCLTAHEAGLGTVILGMLDHDKAKALLGVPEGYEVVAMIPVGYPAKDSAAPKRRQIAEFTHQESF